MKAIQTATALCILAFCLFGCSPSEKEKPKETKGDKLEAVLGGTGPEVAVDVATHVRFENQTKSPIAIMVGSATERIEPGSVVFIPEEYDDGNRGKTVKIAQHKDGEWSMVYASKWVISKKWIESYVANETTAGKFTLFGTRDRVGESDLTQERSQDVVPRRRVVIENEEPIQTELSTPFAPASLTTR
ncbi:hypothetical protein QEH52_19945 [Coraliomargarita sp. SDUM461003]|uniref:Lipoprotein n=1 Tax=Thalassobacterium maritimum TaxID=3041265 RepID=A0ABU1B096_9BACT|nr:hypothetical protein [Coraliomargarita sp. SDUM461003]MDQ8209802.1 hypothetical protein [Coraliomargarita sp. SDUM461003]